VPCAFGVFSTVTAHPGLHNRYSTCTGTAGANRPTGFTGFAAGRAARVVLRVLETRRAAGRALLDRDALIIVVSISLKHPPRQAEYFCFRSKNSSLL
jgi:hypothetical protein